MTLTGIRNSIVAVGVLLLVVMAADAVGFDPLDSDTDLKHDDRKVEVRFYATSGSGPARFDITGGFHADVIDFDHDDKRDGHREIGITQSEAVVWAQMFVRAATPEPRLLKCEVWQGREEITVDQQNFPEFAIGWCKGYVK